MRCVLPVLVLLLPLVSAPVRAELAPLQCGWRTDRVAVHVGEQLQLTLTCVAAATETASVVPNWEPLQPDVVDLAPFEVVAGTRREDVLVPHGRYTQFDYTLRLTGEEFFGLDVPLPPLEIAYRIEVGSPGGNVQQGRERTYVMPPLPMKILSLVPRLGAELEEVPAATFGFLERTRARASMAIVVGCGLLAAAGLCLLLFLGGALRAMRARRAKPAFRVADWRLVAQGRSTLRALAATAARQGWTESRVGEALTTLRVLGALAIGKSPRQELVARRRSPVDGEWILRRWSPRRSRIAITATATALELHAHASPRMPAPAVSCLAAALSACSDVRYGSVVADDARLAAAGRAIQDAHRATRPLLLATLLPARLQVLAVRRAASGAA